MKLVALKRLRYPRGGTDGKEYDIGDTFEADDRSAKSLKLIRAAKDFEGEKRQPYQTAALQPKAAVASTVASDEVADDSRPARGRGRYMRRDMTSEG